MAYDKVENYDYVRRNIELYFKTKKFCFVNN